VLVRKKWEQFFYILYEFCLKLQVFFGIFTRPSRVVLKHAAYCSTTRGHLV